jgi:hypothetical protein
MLKVRAVSRPHSPTPAQSRPFSFSWRGAAGRAGAGDGIASPPAVTVATGADSTAATLGLYSLTSPFRDGDILGRAGLEQLHKRDRFDDRQK